MLAVTGITNKSLRALMTGLLGGATHTMNQASYDLAGLTRNGLIIRVPDLYRLTGTDCGSITETIDQHVYCRRPPESSRQLSNS